MAHYRKVDSRIWNDEKFRALSERGKLSFLFILTNPHTTMIGTLRGTLTGLAAELHATSDREHGVLEGFGEALLEGYIKSFRETIDKGLVRYDERACLIWMPNFLKYNSPESPNVIKSWPKAFDMVSECELKHSVFARMKEYTVGLTKAFHEAFTKAFGEPLPKAMPNQEQEQEQDKNLNNTASQYCLPAANSPAEVDAGLELKIPQIDGKFYPITASQIAQWKSLYPMVDVIQEIRAMIGWSISNPKKRKTKAGMLKFANTWLAGEQKKAAEMSAMQSRTGPRTPSPVADGMASCWRCHKKVNLTKLVDDLFCSKDCADKHKTELEEARRAGVSIDELRRKKKTKGAGV
jgi:hypothetical protein